MASSLVPLDLSRTKDMENQIQGDDVPDEGLNCNNNPQRH
ncbi:hypothetical protein SLEP1_g59910 [Rubroshorea leprosula]|uniref:Uncharacterized protein n=1 Tax=Rubroshorea leprosula TaxID=152421 RepID=A0AAV5MUX0_9ROSI|nr:hypothetical protein SLEP1_g59910 [Rubroshorea leprosula]